jgi:hypothetical protein
MASVKFNAILSELRGSIGNLTFQRNASGYSLRSKPFSNFLPTTSQLDIRQWLSFVQDVWRSMPQTARDDWNGFPSFLKSYTKNSPDVNLPGYQLFVQHNMKLLSAGGNIMTSFDFVKNAFQNPAFSASGTGSVFWIDLDSAYIPEDWLPFFKMSPPLKTPSLDIRSLRVVIPNTIDDWFVIHIYQAYIDIFGRAPLANEYVYVSLQFLNLKMPYAQAPFITYFKNTW